MSELKQDRGLTRRTVTLGVLALPLLAIAACGKKNAPKPPSGDDAPFPREYPNPNQPQPQG